MTKIDFSIIIPVYNVGETIKELLVAIVDSDFKGNYEVILVDDGSEEKLKVKSPRPRRGGAEGGQKLKVLENIKYKILRQEHKGPAAARNLGAKKAKGKILVFLDADVVLEKKSLAQIYKRFSSDKSLVALNGVYSKCPANPSFFTWYFSLFKYFHWVKKKREKYTGFWTGLGIIKRDVFLKLGGFDKKYKDALVEDYEFGYRLGKNYKVIVDDKVKGKHFHPHFCQCFCNYYKRVYLWLKLFKKRKKFDNVTTTFSTGLANGFGFLSLLFLPLTLFYFYSLLFVLPFILSFLIFFWIYGGFHFFMLREKGFFWMLRAIVTSWLLTVPLGGAWLKFLVVDVLRLKK